MYLRPVAVGSSRRPTLLALLLLGTWLAAPAPALARLNGILTSGCNACHNGGRAPAVSISIDPPVVELGATTTLTVRVGASGQAGFYLYSYGKGTFKDPGSGVRLATPTDVIHSMPKGSDGGEVTFQVAWTAPTIRGTVTFEALAVAANGDRNQGGDAAGQGRLSVAIGCVGVERFVDTDKDGLGTTKLPKEQVCEGAAGYAEQAGDCNDYLDYVHPGAAERCNTLDDDCDGQVDEGLESAVVYRDVDGDGYGDRFTTDMKVGCSSSGYAPNKDDCDDADKTINPGLKEVCNNKDDDCNGRVDEGARASCGLGWCRRNAEACDALMCTPGSPRAEQCNLFDDDCDGVIDNSATCEPGKTCFEGRCLVDEDARASAEANAMASDGGAGVRAADGGAPPGIDAAATPASGSPEPGVGLSPDSANTVAKPSSLWGCAYGGAAGDRLPGPLAAWGLCLMLCLAAARRSRS